LKYEDIVITILLFAFVLCFSILIIQSYELKESREQTRDVYRIMSQNTCENTEKPFKDFEKEIWFTNDGLEKQVYLWPKEELK